MSNELNSKVSRRATASTHGDLQEEREQLAQLVKHRTEMLELLNDITAACHVAETVTEAVDYVVKEFCRFNGWCFGHSFRLDRDNPDQMIRFDGYYESGADRFVDFRDRTKKYIVRRGVGLPGRVWETGEPEYVNEITQVKMSADPRSNAFSRLKISSACAFPVFLNEKVIFVLEFFSDRPAHDQERAIEAMENIATQIARVVERNHLQHQLAELAISEQQRFGRELHDSVSQQLAGATMIAESVRKQLANDNHAQADQAATLVRVLYDTQRQVRELAHGLMPVELEANGLMIALENLAEQTHQRHQVECRFRCESDVLLTNPTTASNLYRIAQEAVHNAVKHAQPKRIDVILQQDEMRIQLSILDDGAGISDVAERYTNGGLKIMRHRANVISANLTISRQSDGGTVVRCELPL